MELSGLEVADSEVTDKSDDVYSCVDMPQRKGMTFYKDEGLGSVPEFVNFDNLIHPFSADVLAFAIVSNVRSDVDSVEEINIPSDKGPATLSEGRCSR